MTDKEANEWAAALIGARVHVFVDGPSDKKISRVEARYYRPVPKGGIHFSPSATAVRRTVAEALTTLRERVESDEAARREDAAALANGGKP